MVLIFVLVSVTKIAQITAHTDAPHITVPQQHANAVDDGRLSKSYRDSESVVVINGMSCEAVVEVVVGRVAIKKCCFHFAMDHLSAVPQASYVLIHSCTS